MYILDTHTYTHTRRLRPAPVLRAAAGCLVLANCVYNTYKIHTSICTYLINIQGELRDGWMGGFAKVDNVFG